MVVDGKPVAPIKAVRTPSITATTGKNAALDTMPASAFLDLCMQGDLTVYRAPSPLGPHEFEIRTTPATTGWLLRMWKICLPDKPLLFWQNDSYSLAGARAARSGWPRRTSTSRSPAARSRQLLKDRHRPFAFNSDGQSPLGAEARLVHGRRSP